MRSELRLFLKIEFDLSSSELQNAMGITSRSHEISIQPLDAPNSIKKCICIASSLMCRRVGGSDMCSMVFCNLVEVQCSGRSLIIS